MISRVILLMLLKVSKGAKIRNRYNQVPHLTQDTNDTTSRYLDDILNINNVYFDTLVSQMYPSELQLNKFNTSDTEAAV